MRVKRSDKIRCLHGGPDPGPVRVWVYIVALGPFAPRYKCISLLLSAMGGGVGGS